MSTSAITIPAAHELTRPEEGVDRYAGIKQYSLAQIFAAGNRAMVKPSEYTPATSELMRELAAQRFDADELSFLLGGIEVGEEFASKLEQLS